MSEFLVECNNLTKVYNTLPALNNFSIKLPAGKIIGLLGPNGSGKTTFIKILAGLLKSTSGTVQIDGLPLGIETKAIVSYLPEQTYFNSWMHVNDCIDYFCDFYSDFDKQCAIDMLNSLNVPIDAKLKTLSKGTKEKVQLVMVMSRKAKLYLLDEPIAGVDPAARDFILNTILTNYSLESSVIISTHLIYDIERVIDEFIFINQGSVVMYNTSDNVRKDTGKSIDELFREVFRCYPNY